MLRAGRAEYTANPLIEGQQHATVGACIIKDCIIR